MTLCPSVTSTGCSCAVPAAGVRSSRSAELGPQVIGRGRFQGVAGDEERAEQDGDRVRHQRPGCQVATASAAKLLAGEGASPLRLLDVAL